MKLFSPIHDSLKQNKNQRLPKPLDLLLIDFKKSICIVERTIEPTQRGRVKAMGSWWFAVSSGSTIIEPGQRVDIIGIKDATLQVRLARAISF